MKLIRHPLRKKILSRRLVGITLALVGFFAPILGSVEGLSYAGEIALGIFLLAAILWISEAIPIWSTSLLVISLQVILLSNQSLLLTPENIGGFTQRSYADFYANLAHPIIILFLSGFYLANAAIKYGLDKNLTRYMLGLFGNKPSHILLGLMVSTAVLSAFMSNTATSAMMITVILPIIARLDPEDPFRYGIALAIPCGANIGGVATPIGSPPNAVVLGALAEQGITLGFAQWMLVGVPLVIIMIIITWRLLLFLFPPRAAEIEIEMKGGWNTSPAAIGAYLIFGLTVLLWITDVIHGVPATVVAFLPITLMSISGIIHKNDLKKFSWDVLWLVAGGLSLGMTMNFEGGPAPFLIGMINWDAMGPIAILLSLGLVGYIFSNLISNTVAASILIPIAITMGLSGAVGPDFNFAQAALFIGIMVSFSMLLPISTPPNAIAMSTGVLETRHLLRIGFYVGIAGYAVNALCAVFLWRLLLPSLF